MIHCRLFHAFAVPMLTEPLFYLCAIPAVLLYGIAKGGFGGNIAILSVPLMSLVMPPQQAAAILLPILCRSEEHTSELQSRPHLVCRLLLEKKKNPLVGRK